MYPLAVSALSYVPFVSEPHRAPLSSYLFQVFKLSHVPSSLGEVRALEIVIFSGEAGPWSLQTSLFHRKLAFGGPEPYKQSFSQATGPLEAPGFL